MIDAYKFQTEWEENHMVGVHVRRGDLTIYGKNVSILASLIAKKNHPGIGSEACQLKPS